MILHRRPNQPATQRKSKIGSQQIFYINSIFEINSEGHYTDRALLYQNILEYSKVTLRKLNEKMVGKLVEDKREEKKVEELQLHIDTRSFRIRELAHWLMKNNRQFLNFYTDSKSHTSMNTRIVNNDRLIKNCINDLENSQLLTKVETVESIKNRIPTPIYSITDHGVIMLLLMKYKNAESKDKLKIAKIYLIYFKNTF